MILHENARIYMKMHEVTWKCMILHEIHEIGIQALDIYRNQAGRPAAGTSASATSGHRRQVT